MSELGYESQPTPTRPWKIYTTSTVPTSWKAGETTSSSMNAVSFGFVATAILISLFLIMAILEHLFRPTSPPTTTTLSSDESNTLESASKLGIHQRNETTSYSGGVSVVMPGEKYPTCIAKPAPLPCPRQGLHCPSYQHTFSFPSYNRS